MKLKNEDNMADMNILKGDKIYTDKPEYVLAVTADGYGKRVETREFRTQARGGAGVIAIKFKENFWRIKGSVIRLAQTHAPRTPCP